MKERTFIQKAKEHVGLQEFVRKQFQNAKCGLIEVQHTPVVTRIVIHTITPGLVIGSGGERIRETVERLKVDFKIENPQIDVQRIENPDIDPHIVAQAIAAALEGGTAYKRIGNIFARKIMEAGAIGCEIIMTGKISGQRARRERFVAGYLKKSGETSKTDVETGFAVGNPRLGNIGVTVKIMKHHTKSIDTSRFSQPIVLEEKPKKRKRRRAKDGDNKEEENEGNERKGNGSQA